MTEEPYSLGVFGGSFDPVHCAHIELAWWVLDVLKLQEMRLLPCRVPPHKQGLHASAQQRVEMLQLAIQDSVKGAIKDTKAGRNDETRREKGEKGLGFNRATQKFYVDERELSREGPSFTHDTMAQLRAELGSKFAKPVSINFVMGWDSWQNFNTWYRWQEILQLVNLVVLRRPGFSSPGNDLLDSESPDSELNVKSQNNKELQEVLRSCVVEAGQLRHYAAGKIVLLQSEEINLASTDIRETIAQGRKLNGQVSASVAQYIEHHALYR